MSDKIYGIDLGTTNSCLSVLDGQPKVIPIDGDGIVPSVVSYDGFQFLVGRRALNRAIAYPEQTARSIKRLMGTEEKVVLNDTSYSPEDISAMILSYLAKEGQKITGSEIRRVVITVPAYFSQAQRQATISAGEKANLIVERIINEPTAAALFYDLLNVGRKEEAPWRHALVYDLGGGTFDASVLRMGEITEVLASTGDTHLGGDDFDALIVELLLERLRETHNVDLRDYRPAVARLTAAAEKAKITLSSRGTVLIEEAMIPGTTKTYSLSMELSRSEFENRVSGLLDRSLEFTRKALDESGLKPGEIDRVLLVGGMSRMPAVAERLREIFGHAQMPVVDPDLSVANGAAVQGGLITGENAEQVLIDVTAHTLSVLVNDNFNLRCSTIIPRNTPIPATRSQLYSTMIPNQAVGMVEVYQGESKLPKENQFIGSSPLNLARVATRTPIEIEFSYDLNGMIHVVAEQKGYNRRLELHLDSLHPSAPTKEMNEERSFWDVMGEDDEDEQDENDYGDDLANEPASDEDDSDQTKEAMNFVINRAKAILANLNPGEDKDRLSELLDRYVVALRQDLDDVDELEDELLELMEKNSNG
jgi:molecular chaperone DnaK